MPSPGLPGVGPFYRADPVQVGLEGESQAAAQNDDNLIGGDPRCPEAIGQEPPYSKRLSD